MGHEPTTLHRAPVRCILLGMQAFYLSNEPLAYNGNRLFRGVTPTNLNKFSAHPAWLIQGGQAFISFAVCKSNYKADDFFEQYFVITGLFGGE